MTRAYLFFLFIMAGLATGRTEACELWTTNTPFSAGAPAITGVVVATGITQPTDIQSARDGSRRLFLVQQGGLIKVLDNGTNLLATPFLDVSSLLQSTRGNEEGLLGLAFHPGYRTNGLFFLYYTNNNGSSNVVARFTASPPATNVVNIATRAEILRIAHPGPANHNGGQLQFGPDGYLYIAPGDGGGGCDSSNNAQNVNSLLGKMLRIDVDGASPYAIPPTNPFAGATPGLDEIWAYGLRNPWRFSFDRATGDLFIGDVGQSAREEINFQPASSSGGENYGWKCIEGTSTNTCTFACAAPGMVPPIIEYVRASPRCSVTGGYRYRGHANLPLCGRYVFADYCSGEIIAGTLSNGTWSLAVLRDEPFTITTFGEDEDGELYVGDRTNGRVLKLVPPDADGDGLPDWWETAFFGGVGVVNGNNDSDGDGFSDRQEYMAGTSPINPADLFRISDITRNGESVVIRLETRPGKRYRVEFAGDIASGDWQTLTNNVTGTGAPVELADPAALSAGQRQYRSRLLP
jgi:glucose/arabinose dehydrogenase